MNPFVPPMISCCQQGQFLIEAIGSALPQTSPGVEVLVVNVGSNGNLFEIVSSFGTLVNYQIHAVQSLTDYFNIQRAVFGAKRKFVRQNPAFMKTLPRYILQSVLRRCSV